MFIRAFPKWNIIVIVIVLFASNLAFSQTPGTLKWTFNTTYAFRGTHSTSTPAMDDNGTLYIGTADGRPI